MSLAPYINQAILKSLLIYDPETGEFTWRIRLDARPQWNGRYAGKKAGFAWRPKGSNVTYWSVRIFDWPFLGHRLAWLYMTGEWPVAEVDPRDLDGTNNRWSNLRPATKAQNGANRGKPKTNTSGLKGASWCKGAGRWRATIHRGGRQIWLGYHDTAEDAHAAHVAKAKETSGEYARW